MPPKKTGLVSSTPAVPRNPSTFRDNGDSSGPSSIEESSVFRIQTGSMSDELSAKSKLEPTKLTTLELMCKAIESVGVPRKGASYIAILKWIVSKKEKEVTGQLKSLLRKTVLKALDTGLLKRPAVSKDSTGIQGYFLLNRDKLAKNKVKKKVLNKKKTGPNASESLSDTELTKRTRKKKVERLNKSASEVVGLKVASNAISKKVGTKKGPLKVEKGKTAPAPKRKAATESAPKTTKAATASAPKRKVATESAPKTTKTATTSAPKRKVATESAPKATKAATTSAPKRKATTESVPKRKAATETAPKTVSVPIAKAAAVLKASRKDPYARKAKTATGPSQEEKLAVAASSKGKEAVIHKTKTTAVTTVKPKTQKKAAENVQQNLQKVELVLKAKKGKAKAKQFVEMDPHEPEMTVQKKVAEKSQKKAASKPIATQKSADKEPIPKKKFFTSKLRNARKDLSDSELIVKPVNRKSLYSHTSDTEIEELKKRDATKTKKNASATAKTKIIMKENKAGPSRLKEPTTNKNKKTEKNISVFSRSDSTFELGNRKSLQSSDSDTEVEVKKRGATKTKKNASATNKTKTIMKENKAGPSRLKENTMNKNKRTRKLSDTALKPINRKSLKSYASDTEIDF